SKQPVYSEPQPGRALLYVARPAHARMISMPDFKIFVDDKPAGWLPKRCYLAVQVEPGRRLLWGPSPNESERYDFEAGKTYLLVLEEVYKRANANAYLDTSRWIKADPAAFKELVSAGKLEYVTASAQAMAELGKDASRKYAKINEKTRDIAGPSNLPATFENVWYRPEKKKVLFKGYEASGTLTINADTLEYKSEKKNLSVPLKSLISISQGSFNTFGDDAPWDIVVFTTDAGEEVAAFRDGRSVSAGGATGLILRTLAAAAQRTQKTSVTEAQASATAGDPNPTAAQPRTGEAGQAPAASPASSSAAPQGSTLASPVLQHDTLSTISSMDEAMASECKAPRRILHMEVTAKPSGVKMKHERMVAGWWGERWILDRCGAEVSYDITFTSDGHGGTNINFKTSPAVEQPGKAEAAAPPP
ncbi:MAG TPA: hypothetical protein VE783_11355, partial [Candidatus Limnocylindrales bacterium]|nr:hypothetical protein [Candidatus Limnocylindrales bacterium]